MKFEISELITIGAVIAVLGGFYYNTEHRLEMLEQQIQSVKKTIDKKKKVKK
jgi:hypothetical protein